jgi:outer membrane lipoprotein-sorting protein
MYRVNRILILVTLLVTGLAQGETPTLDAIRSTMDSAWKDIQSLSSDVTMDFVFPMGANKMPLSGVGTFHYLRDKGKDKSRQQITTKIPEPFAMEMKVDVLFDGKKMYTSMELMGQKQSHVGEPTLEQGALPPGGTRLLDSLERHLNITVQPVEKLGENEVYVLEGTPKDGTAPIQKVRIYIDRKMAVQRKTEIFQPDGSIGVTVIFDNFKQNSNPDPSLFIPEK